MVRNDTGSLTFTKRNWLDNGFGNGKPGCLMMCFVRVSHLPNVKRTEKLDPQDDGEELKIVSTFSTRKFCGRYSQNCFANYILTEISGIVSD